MKKDWNKRCEGTIFTILEILIVLAIVLFLCYKLLRSPSLDKDTQKSLSEQGIDTTSQKTILDSTKKKLQGIDQQLMNRAKEVEDIK